MSISESISIASERGNSTRDDGSILSYESSSSLKKIELKKSKSFLKKEKNKLEKVEEVEDKRLEEENTQRKEKSASKKEPDTNLKKSSTNSIQSRLDSKKRASKESINASNVDISEDWSEKSDQKKPMKDSKNKSKEIIMPSPNTDISLISDLSEKSDKRKRMIESKNAPKETKPSPNADTSLISDLSEKSEKKRPMRSSIESEPKQTLNSKDSGFDEKISPALKHFSQMTEPIIPSAIKNKVNSNYKQELMRLENDEIGEISKKLSSNQPRNSIFLTRERVNSTEENEEDETEKSKIYERNLKYFLKSDPPVRDVKIREKVSSDDNARKVAFKSNNYVSFDEDDFPISLTNSRQFKRKC